jgi:probable phosphoglycerate mutase
MSIYVVRHGRTEWNAAGKLQGRLDSPLLPESVNIIKQIAGYLKDKHISSIVSSPLGRAAETSEIISGILGAGYGADGNLIECDHGLCEGMTLDEARARFPAALAARERDKWNAPYPRGESYADVFRRAKLFAKTLDFETNTLIVAHETLNRCLIGHICNWTQERIVRYRQPNNVVAVIDSANTFGEVAFAPG